MMTLAVTALAVLVFTGSPGCPPGEHVGPDITCTPDNPPPCPPGRELSGLFCVPAEG